MQWETVLQEKYVPNSSLCLIIYISISFNTTREAYSWRDGELKGTTTSPHFLVPVLHCDEPTASALNMTGKLFPELPTMTILAFCESTSFSVASMPFHLSSSSEIPSLTIL
mmetsp:Transcript_20891/g.60818  ORF Transcript_20891/g.60818 Transcript_20891/m.60818 type:complete len:111 (-) Transcript_20891:1040-1372(-)